MTFYPSSIVLFIICVDRRQANEAIIRERHPMTTVDELLQDMNGSNVFSKLDMKEGFTQLVLHDDSRDITTLCSHIGLFRYKRLYGAKCFPGIYQAEIQNLVHDCPKSC